MIPKITGFAGDLFVPSKKYMQLTSGYSNRPELKGLVAIADLFLLHDIVSFRAELWTIRELYSCFTMDEMDEMLNNKRISFFLPIYQRGYKKDWLAKIEEKLTKLPEILFKGKFDGSRVTKQIADNLIEQKSFDENFQEFDSTMKELFYKHGIQRDSFFSMDVQIGFDQAIEKIRELWSCGIFSSTLDEEVLFYFDICDKAAYLKENNLPFSDLNNSSRQLVDQLHNFKNCPSLGQILTNSPNPTKSMIEIVNSNEANDLKYGCKII